MGHSWRRSLACGSRICAWSDLAAPRSTLSPGPTPSRCAPRRSARRVRAAIVCVWGGVCARVCEIVCVRLCVCACRLWRFFGIVLRIRSH